MSRRRNSKGQKREDLSTFACPNEDCTRFNQFGAGNLSVCERFGRDKRLRRLYCNCCGHRFSERRGTLMERCRLPEETVVRIVKCLGHGCSVEAAADICEVDPRTVELLLTKAGRRANDFHRASMEQLPTSPPIVEIDELHGAVASLKKGELMQLAAIVEAHLPELLGENLLDEPGFMPPWM